MVNTETAKQQRLDALFDRILGAVEQSAYLPFADVVPMEQRAAMGQIQSCLQAGDGAGAQALVERLFAGGQIDQVMRCSALHVVAASPLVNDMGLAARMVAEQEMAALELGGPRMSANLASVERHRGVLAFLKGQYEVALDYFSRAFERQHAPGNLANVMATLLRLGEETEAAELLAQVRRAFPAELVTALNDMIQQDPDLATLRDEEDPC
jgi:tetratricopeptide (TPR) repeat protein